MGGTATFPLNRNPHAGRRETLFIRPLWICLILRRREKIRRRRRKRDWQVLGPRRLTLKVYDSSLFLLLKSKTATDIFSFHAFAFNRSVAPNWPVFTRWPAVQENRFLSVFFLSFGGKRRPSLSPPRHLRPASRPPGDVNKHERQSVPVTPNWPLLNVEGPGRAVVVFFFFLSIGRGRYKSTDESRKVSRRMSPSKRGVATGPVRQGTAYRRRIDRAAAAEGEMCPGGSTHAHTGERRKKKHNVVECLTSLQVRWCCWPLQLSSLLFLPRRQQQQQPSHSFLPFRFPSSPPMFSSFRRKIYLFSGGGRNKSESCCREGLIEQFGLLFSCRREIPHRKWL